MPHRRARMGAASADAAPARVRGFYPGSVGLAHRISGKSRPEDGVHHRLRILELLLEHRSLGRNQHLDGQLFLGDGAAGARRLVGGRPGRKLPVRPRGHQRDVPSPLRKLACAYPAVAAVVPRSAQHHRLRGVGHPGRHFLGYGASGAPHQLVERGAPLRNALFQRNNFLYGKDAPPCSRICNAGKRHDARVARNPVEHEELLAAPTRSPCPNDKASSPGSHADAPQRRKLGAPMHGARGKCLKLAGGGGKVVGAGNDAEGPCGNKQDGEQRRVACDDLPPAGIGPVGFHDAHMQQQLRGRLPARGKREEHKHDRDPDGLACPEARVRHAEIGKRRGSVGPAEDDEDGGGYNLRKHDVDAERQRAPRRRGELPAPARLPGDHARVGKRAHYRPACPETNHGAQGVRHQVVHVEQAVRVLVDSPDAGELRGFKRQRHQKPDDERLPPRPAEIVAKVGAERHEQKHVEQRLVDKRVQDDACPGGRVGHACSRFG